MGATNVEIVKRAADAFNERDVDTFMAITTPDFEWFPAMDRLLEGGSYRGREGIEAYFEVVSGTWEEFQLLPDEFRDLGDRVLWLGRVEARGRSSGVRVDTPLGAIAEFRDGKMSRIRAYLDHDEALRAAGHSE
ncbi:MAG TPA: nuclear transport factor 2 family protein [Solirubrobacteraceae bacterium]|jgi:ketosteroid isomerase-like protein|nr:nuclear transport factor 2 family protein [Solirubrobacteraceae bacterium]